MLSGVFATTAKMELRNLIDQYCYDCSEGWFMVYAETRGKYEEFYQDFLSDATAKNIRNSFVIWRGNILQDQKSSQSISEWKIICPYMESIPAISLRLVSVSLKT